MNHLDLFSGIGGFSLAASWVWGDEHNIVSFCEMDKFCQKVLAKHWPDVPIIDDIRDVTYERIFADTESTGLEGWKRDCENKEWEGVSGEQCNGNEVGGAVGCFCGSREQGSTKRRTTPTIDLLTGGFPCQPYSCAGKQAGSDDDRALWPEMLRVIREVRPTWVIGENVAGIINMELDQVLSDLEDSEYEAQPFLIGACCVDAPHRRDRVWIVAYSNDTGSGVGLRTDGIGQEKNKGRQGQPQPEPCKSYQNVANTGNEGLQGGEKTGNIGKNGKKPRHEHAWGCDKRGGTEWLPESRLGGMVDGVSRWLDEPDIPRVATGIKNRVNRLKSLGNAICPQVVVPIMECIKLLRR